MFQILVPYGSSSEHGIKKKKNALDSQLAEFSMGILFLQESPFRYKIDSLSDNLPSQEGQSMADTVAYVISTVTVQNLEFGVKKYWHHLSLPLRCTCCSWFSDLQVPQA